MDINTIRTVFPDINFKKGLEYIAFIGTKTVFYPYDEKVDILSILHEVGHIRLNHITPFGKLLFAFSCKSIAFELFQNEVDAWKWAIKTAISMNILVDFSTIKDCLLSYKKAWNLKT